MPDSRVFLDTNILIYAYDVSAKEKHEKARDIVLALWESGLGVLSTQVMQEFFVMATRKIPSPLDIKAAREIVDDLLRWDIVVNDGDIIRKAIDLHERHKFAFWDAMIIEAATRGGAKVLLSEDLSHGRIVNGIKIKNPFL
jgi:predicted nucleic acid-binding protein